MKIRISLVLGLILLCLPLVLFTAATVAAETVADPTAPPAGFKPDAASMYPPTPLASKGGLQGLVTANGGSIAIINGQMVKVGDYYGDAKLIEAANGRAVLQSGTGRQVLYLHAKRRWITHVAQSRPHEGLTAPETSHLEGVVIASLLNVRATAALDAALAGIVKRGDRLLILDRHGEWLRIRKAQLSGFVHSRYVIVSGGDDHARRVVEHKVGADTSAVVTKKGNP